MIHVPLRHRCPPPAGRLARRRCPRRWSPGRIPRSFSRLQAVQGARGNSPHGQGRDDAMHGVSQPSARAWAQHPTRATSLPPTSCSCPAPGRYCLALAHTLRGGHQKNDNVTPRCGRGSVAARCGAVREGRSKGSPQEGDRALEQQNSRVVLLGAAGGPGDRGVAVEGRV